MSRFFALALLVPTSAFAGAPVGASVSGSCPGPVSISASGITPGGNFALISAAGPGSATIPGGPCAGMPSALSPAGLALRGVYSYGTVLNPTLPGGACSAYIQTIDLDTCMMSPAVPLDGPDCWVVDDQEHSSFYGSEPLLYTGDAGTYYDGNWSGRNIDNSGYNYTIDDMPAGDWYVWVHAFDHEGGGWTDKSYGQWDDPGTYDDADAEIVWYQHDVFGWVRSDVKTLGAGTHTWSFGSRVDGNYYTISWDQFVITMDPDYTPAGIVDPGMCM
jgi:hypothetical protein